MPPQISPPSLQSLRRQENCSCETVNPGFPGSFVALLANAPVDRVWVSE
ncbi:hypothetical protein FMEAI12_4630058 [Parafrankia sp. Ea1.12]|nr:hypothetical protein FMEAI12_4630058 [Parafrankia sp. Ea1.12]